MNMPDEQARALEGMAECHLRAADVKKASTHLIQALAIFQRLTQSRDAERVEARLAQLPALLHS